MMIRDIERTLGKRIETRRLSEFNYGGFDPDAKLQTKNGQSAQTGSGGRQRSPGHNGSKPRGNRASRSRRRASQRRHPAGPGRSN